MTAQLATVEDDCTNFAEGVHLLGDCLGAASRAIVPDQHSAVPTLAAPARAYGTRRIAVFVFGIVLGNKETLGF